MRHAVFGCIVFPLNRHQHRPTPTSDTFVLLNACCFASSSRIGVWPLFAIVRALFVLLVVSFAMLLAPPRV